MQAEVTLGNYSILRGPLLNKLTSSTVGSVLVKGQIRKVYSQLERIVIIKVCWHYPLGENLAIKFFFSSFLKSKACLSITMHFSKTLLGELGLQCSALKPGLQDQVRISDFMSGPQS